MSILGTYKVGLSSELTGGNFWQGAAIGLTVSGLNHVAHKIGFRNFVKERLDAMGKKWTDKPDFSLEEVEYLVENDPTLNEMYEQSDKPKIGINSSLNVAGKTQSILESNSIKSMNLGLKAFKNYYSLYQTIGHELYHGIQIVSGRFSAIINQAGLKRGTYLIESGAYFWNRQQDPTNMFWSKEASENLSNYYQHY